MTVGTQIIDLINKKPGITQKELSQTLDKGIGHIGNECLALETTRKISVDRSERPYRYYPLITSHKNKAFNTEEPSYKDELIKEFEQIIKEVTNAAGRSIQKGYKIIDRGMPQVPKSLKPGTMGVYTFFYNGEFLKIGKAGPSSNARFTNQHYSPSSSQSNLSKSILQDEDMQNLGITADNVGEWIKQNTRRIDIILDESLGIFTLELVEAALHYRYEPKYEGFKNQR